LTDVNLLLGRLDPERFGIPVDREAAEARLEELAAEVAAAPGGERGGGDDRVALLAGCLEIADERMADAVRRISLRRGYDPSEYALVAFGGAGGQHAGSLAEHLGVTSVLVPEDAGLLSAAGLGAAAVERFAQRQVLEPLTAVGSGWARCWRSSRRRRLRRWRGRACHGEEVVVRRRIAHLRLEGQETAVPVEVGEAAKTRDLPRDLEAGFGAAYRDLYGYPPPARRIEVESLRAVAASRPEERPAPPPVAEERAAEPAGSRRAWFGAWREVPVFDRAALAPGDRLAGPALVFERHAATAVPRRAGPAASTPPAPS
jgi:5-oxoprolinase (ATP-hydrolysing)